MADSMEGVVADGEQPTPENVEQKTVAGTLTPLLAHNMVTFECPCA